MKVSKLVLLVLSTVLQRSLAQNITESLKEGASAVGDAIGTGVADVANPIAQGISQVAGGSFCNSLKEFLGLDSNNTVGDRAPDQTDLALVYNTPALHARIPLDSAATELPRIFGNLTISKMKIFAHGFTDNPSANNFRIVNEAYRSIGVDSILALDASSVIGYCYLCSSSYVRSIGNKLGETLAELVKIGLLPENIHLVGHSLGAHISGFAGKQFKERTGEKVARITGLDPAGPCFNLPDELKLNSTDAVYVDVIHTDAGALGTTDSVGQADFYPDGGERQRGCVGESCNHRRAVQLFASSITNRDDFPAVQCSDFDAFKEENCTDVVNLMGEGADPNLQGRFFLQTNSEDPYGKGKDGMTYVNTDGIIKRIGHYVGEGFNKIF